MTQVYAEALFVGLASLPTYYLTRAFVSAIAPQLSEQSVEYVSVFLSGGLFHLICEETGINEWYIDNGAVVLKRQAKEQMAQEAGLTDDLCDGSCGWNARDGLCSHYSIHAKVSEQCSSCSW